MMSGSKYLKERLMTPRTLFAFCALLCVWDLNIIIDNNASIMGCHIDIYYGITIDGNRISFGIERLEELWDSTSFVQISNNTIMLSLFLSMHVLAIGEVEKYYECFKYGA